MDVLTRLLFDDIDIDIERYRYIYGEKDRSAILESVSLDITLDITFIYQ
jgi:hypothetical protein